jgi:hypothetical protein
MTLHHIWCEVDVSIGTPEAQELHMYVTVYKINTKLKVDSGIYALGCGYTIGSDSLNTGTGGRKDD